ncbi:MAG: tRNA epoxyqueuosine(34) reductase QueG [Planctomycetes bacterium]|nr:tRNA epoxyqueuosine(34) reductase QueG [Planctomycetota bacterium]
MSGPDQALTQEILETLRGAGFALYGICRAEETSHRAQFNQWLTELGCGEMTYLTEHIEQRMDPGTFVPTARSIICVADRYASGEPDPKNVGASPRGRIARYARGRDYHRVIRERLEPIADDLRRRHPGNRFRVCVDTAPILEREHAQRAGLGRVGKHTLLIGEESVGSWIMLGEIVTSLDLAPSQAVAGDPCGTCTRCIDACPTQAIEPWKLNAQRCISYLTIEHRAEPAAWFEGRSDDWLFGCDACIEACPHSQPRERSARIKPHPHYQPLHADFDLAEVLQWSEESQAAMKLSKVLLRAKLSMWKRNAMLIIAGSEAATWSQALVAALQKISDDSAEEPWLRQKAAMLLQRRGNASR